MMQISNEQATKCRFEAIEPFLIKRFINITKTDNLNENNIYFHIYYDPRDKYKPNTYSSLIFNGLKMKGYYNYQSGRRKHNREYYRLLDMFQNKFIDKFNLANKGYFLCSIPGHEAKKSNINSVSQMIRRICRDKSFFDGSNYLLRYKTIEKQSTSKSQRTCETHLNSIIINERVDVKDKKIILIDDIVTSGYSLAACQQILKSAGASEVICFAFAKTQRSNHYE